MTSIVFTADDNYFSYLPCSFAQLARFGRKADGVVLIAPPTIDEMLLARVEQAAVEQGIGLRVEIASELSSLYSGALIDDYWYMSTSKLFLGDLLPDLDEVLYLDVDILVRSPLDDLLEWKLHHPIGGVVELIPGGTHLFGTPRQPYFNAGVLRMSLERMRREQFRTRALDVLASNVLTLQDQDVFNLIFMDRFDPLPMTYNVFDDVALRHRGLTALHDPVIVHFAGPAKPWLPSSRSRFAREWRRLYSDAVLDTDRAASQGVGGPGAGVAVRRRARRFIRTVVPAGVKRGTENAVLGVLESTERRIDSIRASVSSEAKLYHPLSWGIQFHDAATRSAGPPDGEALDRRIDLIISLPNSGTQALGEAIQRSRPGMRFLPDLFRGMADGLSNEKELRSRFAWFTPVVPRSLMDLSPRRRFEAQRDFISGVSGDVVEFIENVLGDGSDRYLITVLPGQLNPAALCQLLTTFRPRLLFLRRAIAFSYLSQSGDGSLPVDSRQASHYAVRCDSWIDGVAQLAVRLSLQRVWLSYDGLFVTGDDVRSLDSLYPGSTIAVDPETGCLPSGPRDGRSDASIIVMANNLADLSPAAKARVLRLPGMNVGAEPPAWLPTNS